MRCIQVELPKDCQIHPVFHISQLKKAEGIHGLAAALPLLTADLEILVQPADILHLRQLPSHSCEVLVLWEGLDASEAYIGRSHPHP